VTYKIVWESPNTVLCNFYGCVSAAELSKATNDFYNDPRSDNTTITIWDFTEMTGFDVEETESAEIAATDFAASTYLRPIKSAFIVCDPDFSNLVRLYINEMKHYGSHWTNRLFENLDETRRWVVS
jgi:hypothetical protein